MIPSGFYYNLQSQGTNFYLDGNAAKSVYGHSGNGSEFQSWIFVESPINSGYYTIQSQGTSLYLTMDTPTTNQKDVHTYTSSTVGTENELWSFQHVSGFIYNVVNKASGYVLDGNADGSIYGNKSNGGNYQQWDISFAKAMTWDVNFESISYGIANSGPNPPKPSFWTDQEFKNTSSTTTITQDFIDSETVTDSVSWTLTEAMSLAMSLSLSATDLLTTLKVGFNIKFSLSSTETQKTTNSHKVEVDTTVTVQPSSIVCARAYIDTSTNEDLPFIMNISYSLKMNSKEQSVERATAAFKYLNPNLTNVENGTAQLDGTFTGVYGIRSGVSTADGECPTS